MMNPSDPFWRSLREGQDEGRRREDYLSRARALRQGRAPTAAVGRRSPRWVLLAAAALMTAVGGGIFLGRPGHGALRFSTGGEPGRVGSWIEAPDAAPLPVTFSDGSVFRVAAGSQVRVSAVDANGARIVVERGSTAASVVHRAGSRWTVDVGPFEVTVVGTRFDVSWDPAAEVFRLRLDEGAVVVSGACLSEARSLSAGHALRMSCKRDQEQIVETRADEVRTEERAPPARSTEERPIEVVPTAVATSAASAEVTNRIDGRRAKDAAIERAPDILRSDVWHALTSSGRYREALQLVERSGFDETCRRSSGADLLDLGDSARLAGDARRARQAYLAARAKLPRGGRSAYGLGLTAFDQDGDFALAAHWFEVYLADQPQGSLRREAEGRWMESLQRVGDRSGARAAAERYLQDYPDGTQAPLARQIAAP